MTLEWNGAEAMNALSAAAEEGLAEAAKALLASANSRIPLDDGPLRASGRTVTQRNEAAVGYNTPYAIKQHERLSYRHKRGQAKWLEVSLRLESQRLQQIIAERIRGALGG
ncbi:hypothetical protein [Gordonia sp. NB41Y]|uniref:hypothetical protein n=1 Tax=Gordonia sp. NB41Y TaxID=875808 RepID=UPI0002BF1CAF|nr:hypothetical protein [Gordonia sp. NB41Y]EMP10034.1 hypothetical protein ISGA_1814 [Gordonia sp. NB41Y]WLP90255.1 hypothetical protein Q9K23_22520 [Gordonia sp. NB41Y]